jgi:hypothetical protein
MAKALQGVFKQYTRHARKEGFRDLISKKGIDNLEKMVVNPNRPLSAFRQLSFREWLEDHG